MVKVLFWLVKFVVYRPLLGRLMQFAPESVALQ
jgi:hypothetical protein